MWLDRSGGSGAAGGPGFGFPAAPWQAPGLDALGRRGAVGGATTLPLQLFLPLQPLSPALQAALALTVVFAFTGVLGTVLVLGV